MGDFSGRCGGSGRLDVNTGLGHALAGLVRNLLRRVRRDEGLYVVRDRLARNIKAAGSTTRLEICHPRPEFCALLSAASKYSYVSRGART